MSTNTITTSAPEVVKLGTKKFVVQVDGEATSEVFTTKRAAEAEAAQQLADQQPVEPETVDPESMTKTDRILVGKAEAAAVKAWKAAGAVEADRPSTPVLDWMGSTPADKRRATKSTKSAKTTNRRSAEDTAKITEAIVKGRAEGLSWRLIALALDEQVPTSRGGAWNYATVSAIAHRLGLVDAAS